MSAKTLTRAELCETLSRNAGLTRQQSENVLESALGEITQGLKREGTVKISAFGSFIVRSKSARVGRNPKTGQEVTITPRKSLTFRASNILKDRVNR